MQHDPLIEQWLQQQEQQLRQSVQTLISQVRLHAADYGGQEIDLKQLQQAQQQDQQQLRQLQQWLLQAQADKAEALQSLQQLAEQLKLAQQEFRDEKLAHAQTQQQLAALQQQTASALQASPAVALVAEQSEVSDPVSAAVPDTTVESVTPQLVAQEPVLVLVDEQQELQQLRAQQQQWQQLQHKLESQLFRAQARADALEERQLSEAEQGRDTIRELRQQLSQQQHLVLQQQQQLQDVQLQVTEYRLKFEYAQSQLALLQG